MADTFTPFWNLTQPEIGASRDSWGAKLNANTAVIDTVLAAAMPIGGMIDFAGANAPLGWLLADGHWVLRQSFPALFAAIGTQFGAGDGATSFALPDTRSRVTVGVGSNVQDALGQLVSYALSQRGGANGAYIGQGNLPNYQLAMYGDGAHGHGTLATDAVGDHSHTGYTDVQGYHAHQAPFPGPNTVGGGPYGVYSGGPAFQGFTTDGQGSHQHNIQTYGAGTHAHTFTIPGNTGGHYHYIALGGGGVALQIMTMYMAVTKLIYCGAPGTTINPSQDAPAVMHSPRRGLH